MLHVALPSRALTALFVVALSLPVLTVIGAYGAALHRLALPIVQPSEAFNLGLGRVVATLGFAVGLVPLVAVAALRYLALASHAGGESALERLARWGALALCLEALSVAAVAAVPFSASAAGHGAVTACFFSAGAADVALRLRFDTSLARTTGRTYWAYTGRYKQLIASFLCAFTIGVAVVGVLIGLHQHEWIAFLVNAIAELGFGTCLIVFHATDYWLIAELDVKMNVSTKHAAKIGIVNPFELAGNAIDNHKAKAPE
eukprot:TRINITY_DN24390_c0_g2_i1.p1 TRINITY_DN24390_c0_g2~~TRINITY_DN24390_c0_g2_i1.p1  ORF type:complete len:259 (-),score=44.13 TRINITY_DN24390_c0_g2_i1:76-852(-)